MFAFLREWFNGVFARRQNFEPINVDDGAAQSPTIHRRRNPQIERSNDLNLRPIASESSDSESDVDAEARFRYPRGMPLRVIARTSRMESASNYEARTIAPEQTNVDRKESVETNVNAVDGVSSEVAENRGKRAFNDDAICFCGNCSTVRGMSECAVCLEPLQIRGVRSCTICANLVCSGCATRLKKCAFCRVTAPTQRNRAIERLLGKMRLPCRNARNGCDVVLKADSRLAHEARCHYALASCPRIRGSCRWEGSPSQILHHLKQCHKINPIPTSEIIIQVRDLYHNFMNNDAEGTFYLMCFGQLFAVRVRPSPTKIILGFFHLGYIGRPSGNSTVSGYAADIKATSNVGKLVCGDVTFDRYTPQSRAIDVGRGFIYSRNENRSKIVTSVNVEISIKEINDA